MNTPKLGAPAPTESLCTRRPDLSGTRRLKGVSLEEIAERTKISLRFLRAIEAGEFEKLPGGIFNTSYLRQYAAAIGFDEAELLAHYDSSVKVGHSPGVANPGSRNSRGFFDRWLRLSTPV
jgi:cytoskeletal protein RodZ